MSSTKSGNGKGGQLKLPLTLEEYADTGIIDPDAAVNDYG
jgi:hypothetical protein